MVRLLDLTIGYFGQFLALDGGYEMASPDIVSIISNKILHPLFY